LSSHRFSSDFGDILYVDEGTGPAVLLAHGIYGGHDNATDMVEVVLGSGYRTIGPSRFGYFGSSLPVDATVEGQADAFVKLLDHLGIDKVIAVGYSGRRSLRDSSGIEPSSQALRPHSCRGLLT
jgi:pimeloyl-ACP methyl ester carboxylesterase